MNESDGENGAKSEVIQRGEEGRDLLTSPFHARRSQVDARASVIIEVSEEVGFRAASTVSHSSRSSTWPEGPRPRLLERMMAATDSSLESGFESGKCGQKLSNEKWGKKVIKVLPFSWFLLSFAIVAGLQRAKKITIACVCGHDDDCLAHDLRLVIKKILMSLLGNFLKGFSLSH